MTQPDRLDRFEPLRFDSSTLPTDLQYSTYASAMTNFSMWRAGEGEYAARALVLRVGNLVITMFGGGVLAATRVFDVGSDEARSHHAGRSLRGTANVFRSSGKGTTH